jgi:hypothetical protein
MKRGVREDEVQRNIARDEVYTLKREPSFDYVCPVDQKCPLEEDGKIQKHNGAPLRSQQAKPSMFLYELAIYMHACLSLFHLPCRP